MVLYFYSHCGPNFFADLLMQNLKLDPLSTFLNSITEFGKFVSELEGKFRAVVRVEIFNYANVGMHSGTLHQPYGQFGEKIPVEIPPGIKAGFTMKQNKPGKGVQVAGYWTIGEEPMAAFLTEVWQKSAWREKHAPNKLGVQLAASHADPDNYETWSSIVTQSKFSTHLKQVKHCSDRFCIVGVMENANHCNITISLYPRCAEWLAYKLPDNANRTYIQSELNAIIGEKSSDLCETDAPLPFQGSTLPLSASKSGKVSQWLVPVIILLAVLTIAAIVIKFKKTGQPLCEQCKTSAPITYDAMEAI